MLPVLALNASLKALKSASFFFSGCMNQWSPRAPMIRPSGRSLPSRWIEDSPIAEHEGRLLQQPALAGLAHQGIEVAAP